MFHHSVLGRYGEALRPWADVDGWVPESGDHPADFHWPAGCLWSAETWEDHVKDTCLQTETVMAHLRAWQGRS